MDKSEIKYFLIKKWFLFFICSVDIVIYIVYASRARHFAHKWMEQHNQTLEAMEEAEFNEVQVFYLALYLYIHLSIN